MKKSTTLGLATLLTVFAIFPAVAGEGADAKTKAKFRAFEIQEGGPGSIFFSSSSDHPFALDALLGKGFLGVGLTDLTAELRAHFAESEDAGIMVDRVIDGSPAARAGLQVGDVITSIDGELVKNSYELTGQIRRHEPEDQVSLEIFRDGQRQLIDVTLAERERATVDVGEHLSWNREGEDGPWLIELDDKGMENFPEGLIDRAKLEKLRGTLEKIDWKTMAEQAGEAGPRDEELRQRLEKLEERLKKLDEELSRLRKDQ